MMPADNRRILLIDGNNLAHFLYTNLTPGQKMTPADSQRLITHLGEYARTYHGAAHPHQGAVEVELCLDRSPGYFEPGPDNLQVLFAEYPQTGDDLLLGRFWFHQLGHRPAMVITNDEAILEEVAAVGNSEVNGLFMRVYDFVRRPGLVSPVFRAPDELPFPPEQTCSAAEPIHPLALSTSIYYRIVTENRAKRAQKPAEAVAKAIPIPPIAAKSAPVPERTEPKKASEAAAAPIEVTNFPLNTPPTAVEGPYYFLSLDTWPIGEGMRFLRNAFCGQHRVEYQDLINTMDADHLRPADLRALGELLLYTCGDEPDFAKRGALMTRVRLALLQARGEALSLSELAEQTGLKISGLRGRIKEKARPWIEILD